MTQMINKEFTLARLSTLWSLARGDEQKRLLGKAMNVVDQTQAEDVVPVVRCKDCRYAHMTYNGECKYCDFWQEEGGDALYLDGDFYCAAGDHREGGNGDAGE